MKPMRLFGLMVAVLHLLCVVTLFPHISADGKPSVQFNADHAVPRQVDESVQQAIARDYSAAWQALGAAMATNSPGVLNENFVGLALDKLTRRIRDQESLGLRTRIIDRGHKVEAIFYSIDGSAMELKDMATIETQILEGNTVIHTDRAQIEYFAVMTGAEDHWKVRVLETAPAKTD